MLFAYRCAKDIISKSWSLMPPGCGALWRRAPPAAASACVAAGGSGPAGGGGRLSLQWQQRLLGGAPAQR
jgi:hypothetical protein